MPQLLPGLDLPLSIERQVLAWFAPRNHKKSFLAENFPIFIWEHQPERTVYGFPDLGTGVKVAVHHEGEAASPDALRREVTSEDLAPLRALLEQLLPDLAGPPLSSEACMYTNTPDRHFLIDHHPDSERVLILSPCSGHGFKFAPAIGGIAADLVCDGATAFDLGRFRLARLRAA
jgi:sarcosine oxidase